MKIVFKEEEVEWDYNGKAEMFGDQEKDCFLNTNHAQIKCHIDCLQLYTVVAGKHPYRVCLGIGIQSMGKLEAGISTSYNDVRRSRNLMCAYTLQSSGG